jgi:hypothetical protein
MATSAAVSAIGTLHANGLGGIKTSAYIHMCRWIVPAQALVKKLSQELSALETSPKPAFRGSVSRQ